MENKEIKLPQDIYNQDLAALNEIKFTRREIDVIAFIVNGRSTKKIASSLTLAPKTIDNHIHNVMLKLDCHSRENIIDFIEKSEMFPIIRRYYLSLLIKKIFKDKLKEISQLVEKKTSFCMFVFCCQPDKQNSEFLLIERLRKHLKLAGTTISFKSLKQYESLVPHFNDAPTHTLFIVTDIQKLYLEKGGEDTSPSLFELIQSIKQRLALPSSSFSFLLLNRAPSLDIPEAISDIGYVEFRETENYYFLVLALLKKIYSALNFDKIISEFTRDCSLIDSAPGRISRSTWPKVRKVLQKAAVYNVMEYFFKIRKRHVLLRIVSFVFLICLFYIFFLILNNNAPHKVMAPLIHSDFIIPFENTMLDRSELLSKIEKSFKGTRPLKTVALIGIAGAGKTTLARQYTRTQTAPVIWEVNAETEETLVDSFENLAQALSTTEEDQKILRGLQEIKDSKKRGERIVQFVKDHLKLQKDWILIYDNVELFPDFQKHFPQDNGTWGQGKVLITTRDSNIQNMRMVAAAIEVNELTPSEKLILFMKILHHGVNQAESPHQTEELNAFLKCIPPFPLDISVAAYYIRSTQVTYEKYLKRLSEYKKDFIKVQEHILKGTDYPKNRYSIITLSLDQLMELHKDFPYFLLLVSLVDSQNIPRDLLETSMNEVSVDDFIFHLKKYSLITDHSSTTYPWGTTFSIHRSTQAISLAHLKERLALKPGNSLIQLIIQNLESYVKRLMEKEDLSQLRLLTTHYEAFLNHPQLLAEEMKGSLLGNLGGMYLSLGNYIKAEQILKDGLLRLGANNKHKPPNYVKQAQVLAYLGNAYGDLGNYEKAKNFLEQSLLIYKKHLPTNHEGVAWALTYLGNVYRDLGDSEKARELLEQSLHIYKTHTPENHVEKARASAYLGITYTILGEYENAKNILEQSLYIYKTHLSKNHVGIAWVSAHLGNAYGELGNYQKARDLLEQSIILYKEHFPENHIKVGWALSYLGDVYRVMGEHDKAKKALEQSMVIYKKHLPDNHIVIAGILVYLSNVHKDLGEYEKAKELLEQSLIIYEKHFPANHPETAWAVAHLGDIYRIMGNFEKAGSLLEKSLTSYRQHFSEDHNEIVWALERLRYAHDKISDYKKDQVGNSKL